MTVVPAVVGQQISAADTALGRASLAMDENEEFSETAAKGIVLRIEPGAGTELSKDATVRVVVSKGQERYAVPSLVGTKAADLAKALDAAHPHGRRRARAPSARRCPRARSSRRTRRRARR